MSPSLPLSLLGLSCAPSDAAPAGPSVCDELSAYQASSTTPLTFAADIQPIMATAQGCGLASTCHGDPPSPFKSGSSASMLLTGDAVMARQKLLGASVNAPSIKVVMPGVVANSFMAYKLSKKEGLACVQTMCVAGATKGTQTPCGDAMPSTGGNLSASDRTKILDWIAQGAN